MALSERMKSNAPRSTDRKPVTPFTSTGKNVISDAISTFGIGPNPNHITNSGATATTGVTFTRIASGNRLRSITRECAISVAPTSATAVPSKNPAIASPRVIAPCPAKNPMSPASRATTFVGAGTMYSGVSLIRVHISHDTPPSASTAAGGMTYIRPGPAPSRSF